MNPGTDRRGPLLIHVWAVLDRLLADGLWHPETDVIDTVTLTTGAAHRTVENQLRSGSAKGWVNRQKRPTRRYVRAGPKPPPDRVPDDQPRQGTVSQRNPQRDPVVPEQLLRAERPRSSPHAQTTVSRPCPDRVPKDGKRHRVPCPLFYEGTRTRVTESRPCPGHPE